MQKKADDEQEARFRSRAYPRCDLKLETKLELEDGREVSFRTSNISQNGFAGHSIDAAPVGSEVELHLPKIGTVAGEVVWQVGTAMGARLASTLSVTDIMALALDNLKAREEEERRGRS